MRRYILALTGLVFLFWLLAVVGSAWGTGATYTVNTTSDTNDGSCDALGTTTDCTLREAINAAGANAGTDTIAFDIPITDTNYAHNTTGVWTVVLTTTLNSPNGDVVDGTTQATNYGSDTNPYGPEIEISGENLLSFGTMWSIQYSNNTIKGLAINRGTGYGIFISGGDDNTIIGNYFGTDATGTTGQGMVYQSILIGNGAERSTIGGPSQADRNVISGNDGGLAGGIRIFGATTTDNVIEGNYIGTDRTGSAPLGNEYGIKIHGDAHDNTIGPNNVIAHNNGDGVWVAGSNTDGNTITQNSIHTNGDLGIELTNSGNGSIAPPVISSNTCISASGTAPISATVELFSGWDGEGETYLTTVSADGSGNWSASGFLADEPYLTATATDTTGNTSEFSAVAPCGSFTYVPLVMKNH